MCLGLKFNLNQNFLLVAESPCPSEAETMKSTLVVDVTEPTDTDSLSVSSLDSYNCLSEDVVRSSPASTILRPRSGKEYQQVERRRTHDGSTATSPLTTPQSSANGSVFTFDNVATASLVSGQSDPQSPRLLKGPPQSEQASICPSVYSENVQSPRALYMNIDFSEMSPPESPGPVLVSLEQVDPMLNYAEIDLSDTGRSENQSRKLNYAEMDLSNTGSEKRSNSFRQTKKGKKVPEPIPIEYSMIDMVATKAAQKARKEHAQNRDGSLRRERYSSLSSNSFSTKERVASLSSRFDRKQSGACSAGQSTTSVDSANF